MTSPTSSTLSQAENTDSSEHLEKVLDTVIDGIITIDDQGMIRSFNRSAERIFGYNPEDVIGQNVKILMPDPYQREHDDYIRNYLNTGDAKAIGKGREVEAKRKDDSIFPMELGINEMNISGNRMFVGTIRDISDRKIAEQKLKDEEARLQAILDNTVDGMIIIDEMGHIESFNKACERIFGYLAEEVVGENVKMLMPDPYQKEHDQYLQNYHNTGDKKIIGIGRQVEGKKKNGAIFPLDLSVSEVNMHGRTIYSGIVRDITERKESEDALLQANSELEEFAYRTSHDLRAPLVSSIALLGAAQKALASGAQDTVQQCIKQTTSSLETLETLVTDILSLTAAKNVEEEKQSINMEVLVEKALEKFVNMDNFERLDIQTNFQFTGKLTLQKSRIILIIENLISNAIKYQNLSQTVPFIKISTHQTQEGGFVFEVCDNGLGIPKDSRKNLFMMFKRFHPRTSFGSGLGLYMIKKSADILGGKIEYESMQEGSVFRLTLPSNML